MAVRRFLLDQNFPEPVFQIAELDPRIEYVHLRSFAPELSRVSTPDWMLYLAADAADLDGIVTRDRSQLDQEHELIALTCTRLTLVTWRHRIEDPVVEWGQLLAYSPQILRAMDAYGPSIILLPAPRLGAENFELARPLGQELASRHKISYPELRSRAIGVMQGYLKQRKEPGLGEILGRDPSEVRPERPRVRPKKEAATSTPGLLEPPDKPQ